MQHAVTTSDGRGTPANGAGSVVNKYQGQTVEGIGSGQAAARASGSVGGRTAIDRSRTITERVEQKAWFAGVRIAVVVSLSAGFAGYMATLSGFPAHQAAMLAVVGSTLVGLLVVGPIASTPAREHGNKLLDLASRARRAASAARDEPIERLLAVDPQDPMGELVAAIRDAMLEAHSLRLEASRVRREFDHRVASSTRLATASLTQLAHTDALTGLGNRRDLEHKVPSMIARRSELRPDLALLAIDLDRFKEVNDTLGHEAGDAVLRTVGDIIKASLRGRDAAFRLGGDEFVIVLADVTRDHAVSVGMRLLRLFQSHPDNRTFSGGQTVGMSVGVAMLVEDGAADCGELLKLADTALYAAKSAGRQTVRCTRTSNAVGSGDEGGSSGMHGQTGGKRAGDRRGADDRQTGLGGSRAA